MRSFFSRSYSIGGAFRRNNPLKHAAFRVCPGFNVSISSRPKWAQLISAFCDAWKVKTGVPSKWRAEVKKAHFFDFLNPPPLSKETLKYRFTRFTA